MTEINLFVHGDSKKLSTWSNIPFLFAKTLEDKGIIVNRIDIVPDKTDKRLKYYTKLWDKVLYKIVRVVFKSPFYTIDRSIYYRKLVNRIIKDGINKYPHANFNFFLTFSYTNKSSNIPSLLFCDWTYSIYLKRTSAKSPGLLERAYISYERSVINHSDVIISMFKKCTMQMQKEYPSKHILNLGLNLVNDVNDQDLDEEQILNCKSTSQSILFIGGYNYLEAAKKLINTFIEFLKLKPSATLHIVGLPVSCFDPLPQSVNVYGYLDKSDITQRNTYYKLLSEAFCFINPSVIWGGYSSTIEAMYYYTPIVVTPYDDFVADFGEHIAFGEYISDCSENSISESLLKIFDCNDYKTMCINAHNAVKEYTWNNYSNKIIEQIDDYLNNK